MGNAASFALHGDAELGNGNGNANTVAEMVEAGHDATMLRRALFAGGVGKAAAALCLALCLRNGLLLRSYYFVLVAVVLFGVAEAWVGLWVSHQPRGRRAAGMTVLCLSVIPMLILAGVGGSVILK